MPVYYEGLDSVEKHIFDSIDKIYIETHDVSRFKFVKVLGMLINKYKVGMKNMKPYTR